MAARLSPTAWRRAESVILTVIRATWLAVAIVVLVLLIPEAAATFESVHHACPADSCDTPQMPAPALHTLHSAGISLDAVGVYVIGLALVTVAVCYAVACGLMWRRNSDPMVILTAFVCVLLCTAGNVPLRAPGGPWTTPSDILVALSSVVGPFFLYLFPSGRFVPRWTVVLAIGFVAIQYLPNSLLPDAAWPLLFAGFLASIVVLQVYRYRRRSTPVQRQQTKIVVFGIGITCLGLIAAVAVFSVDSDMNGQALTLLLTPVLTTLAPLPFVVSVGLAVVRYRLWDVDLLISRTLVYLILTASLAIVYLGSVIVLQAGSRTVIGRQSDLAVAVSTLVIAALFNPLRKRIQSFIARAFYRYKYDAAKVLAAFGADCRDETDLENLRSRLLQVVEGTVQPAHASLWLLDRSEPHPARS